MFLLGEILNFNELQINKGGIKTFQKNNSKQQILFTIK